MDKSCLTDWDSYCSIIRQGGEFLDFQFSSNITKGDVNRFNARYTFLKDFEALKIRNCSEETNEGYTALMKVTLLWGVAEKFMEIAAIKRTNLDSSYDLVKKTAFVSNLGTPHATKVFQFISADDNTNSTHKNHINWFLSKEDCGLSYLVTGIRNTFAHGTLTPHSGGVKPKQVVEICNHLLEFYLPLIDESFSTYVKAHPRYSC